MQCAKLVEEFGLVHLSAGDLLRAHMKSGTPDGNMVADMIRQGTIVPSHVSLACKDSAMNGNLTSKRLDSGLAIMGAFQLPCTRVRLDFKSIGAQSHCGCTSLFCEQVTISLLEKAMNESGKKRFLIDGFPRNEENRASFESQVGILADKMRRLKVPQIGSLTGPHQPDCYRLGPVF